MAEKILQNTDVSLGARVEFVYQWSKWMESFDNCFQTSPIVSEQSKSGQSNVVIIQPNAHDQIQSSQSNQPNFTLQQSNTACIPSNLPLQANEILINQSETQEHKTSSKQELNRSAISLSNVLNSDTYGKSVMESYQRDKSLNDNSRKLLVESVLQYCIANQHDLSVADCALLSKEISEEFAGEEAVYHHSFFYISCLNY